MPALHSSSGSAAHRVRRRWRLSRVVPAGLVLLLSASGCVQIPRERLEIRRYALQNPVIPEAPDTEYPGAAARAAVLPVNALLTSFSADAPQNGERMVFCPEENRIEYYFYHRWISTPPRMLEDILAAKISEWGICGRGLLRADAGLIPDFEIGGRLTTLLADNREDAYAADLGVVMTIVRVDPQTLEKKPVFQKTYLITEPRRNDRVDSFVEAANRAVAPWLIELRPDLERVFGEESGR
jgi:ABC-type uncharacterized transport system auxiliary subunit